MNDGIPRNCDRTRWTKEEKMIQDAVDAVEALGAHPLLTDTVILLGNAREKLASFVDLPKEARP